MKVEIFDGRDSPPTYEDLSIDQIEKRLNEMESDVRGMVWLETPNVQIHKSKTYIVEVILDTEDGVYIPWCSCSTAKDAIQFALWALKRVD